MQYRAVGRRCTTGSATVLGDLAQGTTPWATATWAEALATWASRTPGRGADRGFRVPARGHRLRLPPAAAHRPRLAPATSVRESPGALTVRAVPAADLDAAVRGGLPGVAGARGLDRPDRRRRPFRRWPRRWPRPACRTSPPARRPRRRPASPWSRPRWRRAWSTTTWCWTSRRRGRRRTGRPYGPAAPVRGADPGGVGAHGGARGAAAGGTGGRAGRVTGRQIPRGRAARRQSYAPSRYLPGEKIRAQ